MMRKSGEQHRQSDDDLRDKGRDDLPEGLTRPRKGPVNKSTGRHAETGQDEPEPPGQPAGGE